MELDVDERIPVERVTSSCLFDVDPCFSFVKLVNSNTQYTTQHTLSLLPSSPLSLSPTATATTTPTAYLNLCTTFLL